MNGIFGNTLSLSEHCLDSLWSRQQVTLNNIANVDTPGYKASYVSFEDELRRRLVSAGKGGSRQTAQAISQSRHYIHDTREESARMDGNNVNADVESVELVRAVLQYQFEVNSLNGDITRLRTVLKG